MLTAFLIFIVISSAMTIAAISDVKTMTIPNWISLYLLAGFFLLIPFTWQGADVLMQHFTVGAVMFVIGFVMFALGWLGGGDAKLMAATSIWWMWPDLLLYVVYTTVAGGALALFIMVGRQYVPVRIATHPWLHNLFNKEDRLPYGVALGVGALATLPQSDIFASAMGLL